MTDYIQRNTLTHYRYNVKLAINNISNEHFWLLIELSGIRSDMESVIDGDMLPPLSLLLLQKMAANTAIARIRLSAVDGAFTADVEDALDDESVTEDEPVL